MIPVTALLGFGLLCLIFAHYQTGWLSTLLVNCGILLLAWAAIEAWCDILDWLRGDRGV